MNSLLPLLILLILGVIYVGTSGDNNSLIGIFAIIIAMARVTLIYTVLGGLKAVIRVDSIQFIIY